MYKPNFIGSPLALTLALICAAFSNVSIAKESQVTDIQKNVEQAISRFENRIRDKISFVVKRFENEEGDISQRVERYDPSNNGNANWQLISVNGNTPSTKQRQQYLEEKLNRQKEGKAISIRLRELIEFETLTVTHENGTTSTAAFEVNTKPLGIDASGKLAGKLRYNKQLAYIEAINITNKETFSPMFSAEITDLDVSLEFSLFNDEVVIQKQAMEMKGSYAFFAEIEEVSTATYSDYKLLF
ncbi:hypothetical protein [Thalassotalea fusca]